MRLLAATASLALLVGAAPAWAQNYSIDSITDADFGTLVTAANGTTTFRADPATGAVTRISGGGTRLSGGQTRALVTISCKSGLCNFFQPTVVITAASGGSGKATGLQNMTVSDSGLNGSFASTPGSGDSITFALDPIPSGQNRSFWVGMDLGINGASGSGATGAAMASFSVSVGSWWLGKGDTLSGIARANVLRPLALSKTADLAFGAVSRPTSGSGTVRIDANGTLSLSGGGMTAYPGGVRGAAAFTVSGEGGQSVSVSVPSSFTMSGSGGTLTVDTLPDNAGSQVLSGSLGNSGSLSLNVGGQFPLSSTTKAGAYSGTFLVTVQYE